MQRSIISFLLIVGLYFIFSAYTSIEINLDTNKWLYENYNKFEVTVNRLLLSLETQKDENEIKINYENVQQSFRKIQFLLDYISEESVKRYINGAPLPTVEQSIPTVNVLEPRGLQVIDEILYDENIDYEKAIRLTNELKTSLNKLSNIFTSSDLYEADIKRAVYRDIVKIYTLQLTGFDTPGSLSGIQNSMQNLNSISDFLNQFYSENENAINIAKHCKKASDYLEKTDFDNLDRVALYKNYFSPILKLLSKWHTNDLPIISRNVAEKLSINYQSDHLFSTSLFNMEYYTQLPKETITNTKIVELGKKLFYDPILSKDNKMSCSTCHNPDKAFTDGLQKTITNKENLVGLRNTPTLINSVLTKGYFYDLREDEPARQIVHVVKNKNEFDSDFIDIMDRLEANVEYKNLINALFPEAKISKYSITAAITAYVASLTSFDSPFDQYMRDEISSLDPKIIRGFNLFAGKAACATCHFIPTFSGLVPGTYKESESEVLGVPEVWVSNGKMVLDFDLGRAGSGKPRDEAPHLLYSFKTTTLRNVGQTAPYMHNGSFKSLKEVMDFYNKGGGAGLGFDLEFQTLSPDSLDLNENEIDDIIAFMKSLTNKPLSY